MIKIFFLATCLFVSMAGFSQKSIATADRKKLAKVEDTLDALGSTIMDDSLVVNRIRSDSFFTRGLVRALKVPYSFYYPFDSVGTLTVRYPADSSFRIFTWEYMIDEQNFRQKGAIQKNTPDGSLVLYPLFDASEYSDAPNDSVRYNTNWVGAIYYNIIQKEYNGQKFYTLLGYDENGFRSTKKWIDVLTFDANGQPVFGGDYFSFNRRDSVWQSGWQRFNIEYKKQSSVRLMYDAEKDLIVYDHLISEINEPEKKYSYIPDGDFEGLKWEGGKWVHVDNAIEGMALKDGDEPRPELLMDGNGEINEAKLDEQSNKNAAKKVQAKTVKKKAKVEVPVKKVRE